MDSDSPTEDSFRLDRISVGNLGEVLLALFRRFQSDEYYSAAMRSAPSLFKPSNLSQKPILPIGILTVIDKLHERLRAHANYYHEIIATDLIPGLDSKMSDIRKMITDYQKDPTDNKKIVALDTAFASMKEQMASLQTVPLKARNGGVVEVPNISIRCGITLAESLFALPYAALSLVNPRLLPTETRKTIERMVGGVASEITRSIDGARKAINDVSKDIKLPEFKAGNLQDLLHANSAMLNHFVTSERADYLKKFLRENGVSENEKQISSPLDGARMFTEIADNHPDMAQKLNRGPLEDAAIALTYDPIPSKLVAFKGEMGKILAFARNYIHGDSLDQLTTLAEDSISAGEALLVPKKPKPLPPQFAARKIDDDGQSIQR